MQKSAAGLPDVVPRTMESSPSESSAEGYKSGGDIAAREATKDCKPIVESPVSRGPRKLASPETGRLGDNLSSRKLAKPETGRLRDDISLRASCNQEQLEFCDQC